MSRVYKFSLLVLLAAATLACGLITNPINQAKSLEATAQALASAVPIETLQALPSAMPSGIPNIPDFGSYLDPSGQPVSDWNGIPIMSQATAGQEFDKTTYSFKVSGVAASDVQSFYDDKMKSLGWASAFGLQGGGDAGVMLFTKDNNSLTIMVTTNAKNETVVILFYQ